MGYIYTMGNKVNKITRGGANQSPEKLTRETMTTNNVDNGTRERQELNKKVNTETMENRNPSK